jgi:hypothetical protein
MSKKEIIKSVNKPLIVNCLKNVFNSLYVELKNTSVANQRIFNYKICMEKFTPCTGQKGIKPKNLLPLQPVALFGQDSTFNHLKTKRRPLY